MVNAIMALPDIEQHDLSSVRLVINGGEKMPIPLIERLQRTFPSAWFADAYGLTETVSGDTFLDPGSMVTKLGSVGRPCLYLDLDIWDEQGSSVAAGERGEIVMRGPKVFKGGENIASSEVERVLYEHDAVLEAAVVGRSDDRWGEVPVAFVVLRPGATATEDALLDHCQAQLARFKTPKAITFLDALPRNPSGKVLKRELRNGE
jgi:acyl-CoA synthetase (AMP-forming)/AMP-acid ligase II